MSSILFIEGHPSISTMVNHVLAHDGHAVHTVSTLVAAEKFLNERQPTLLIIDGEKLYRLGLREAERLQLLAGGAPMIIFPTAFEQSPVTLKDKRLVLFLLKPFGCNDLLEAVKTCLNYTECTSD